MKYVTCPRYFAKTVQRSKSRTSRKHEVCACRSTSPRESPQQIVFMSPTHTCIFAAATRSLESSFPTSGLMRDLCLTKKYKNAAGIPKGSDLMSFDKKNNARASRGAGREKGKAWGRRMAANGRNMQLSLAYEKKESGIYSRLLVYVLNEGHVDGNDRANPNIS